MLAILTTHPIQYQVPLWQALAREGAVPFEVWYFSDHGIRPSYDVQFGKSFSWDLDTLDGYPSRFLKTNADANVARFNQVRLEEPLGQLMKEKRVSALWIQGWQVRAYWQAVWQAHAARVPVWLRGESNDLQPVPVWKKQARRIMHGRLFKRVRDFLYIGQANRRLYESYGVRDEQLHPAPYCVDNERFARQASELMKQRAAIRREWRIPENALCLLFAGKFIPKKRPSDLIAAALDARLRNLGRPLHLLFVGSGELGEELRAACRVVFDADAKASQDASEWANGNDGERAVASFTGFLNQTEISKAYVAADCLVLPSDHQETWGLVVNEAMASGLPCIVSDACGCGEDLIAPINPAFRFPLGQHEAIANAVLALLKDAPPPAVWREQVDKYDLSVSVNTVRRLYQTMNVRSRNGQQHG
ncbi:MAG TPA: glycosyltransferase family 4 protein [Pyrinomonadaceae bacterium]|jgi:glycosyltransferase involved in cell wall biosynthesis